MPADAWVALVLGVLGIIGTIITVAWYLGGKLAVQDTEMASIKKAIVKMEEVLAQVAQDRAERIALARRMDEMQVANERRFATFERWYEELRRGDGYIRQRTTAG